VFSSKVLPLYPKEITPGIHFIGGWVEPMANVNVGRREIFLTLLDRVLAVQANEGYVPVQNAMCF
jgi:hypothetical protein